MKHTVFLSTAAILATALLQPLQAKPNQEKGRAKHPGAVQKGRRAGAAAHIQAHGSPKQFAQHSRLSPKQFTQRSQAFRQQAQASPKQFRHRPPNRQQQTFAFGGANRKNDERNVTIQNNRFNERNITVQNFRRPPVDIYRNWDRRRVHVWNNHHYRWNDNDWVIVASGYNAPYYEPGVVVSRGDGNTALAVQEELSRRGYNPGTIDGVIGPQTRDAIADFQSDHSLPVTGQIDPPLLRSMGL
jgi:hypothetical protein